MFARKIQSVIWMDKKAKREGKDARRSFESMYIFDDGYSEKKSIVNAVSALGFDIKAFLYIQFCGMWYAVHIESYHLHIVITKENICYKLAFKEPSYKVPAAEYVSAHIRAYIGDIFPDGKKWQDGIALDMAMADPDMCVTTGDDKCLPPCSILWNNAVITFGRMFFAREIKIVTDNYTSQVLSNYYSNRSLDFMYDDILALRRDGYQYYNPFTGEKSRTEQERTKKEKEKLEGLEVPPCIKREEITEGVKLMREREVRPRGVYERTDRWFWVNGGK